MEIRDKKYYSEVLGFGTFEAYCKSKWDFTRDYAYKLISSSSVIDNVDNCIQKPVTESQTRPLARLEPEKQREAYQQPSIPLPGALRSTRIDDRRKLDISVLLPPLSINYFKTPVLKHLQTTYKSFQAQKRGHGNSRNPLILFGAWGGNRTRTA